VPANPLEPRRVLPISTDFRADWPRWLAEIDVQSRDPGDAAS